jgi:Ni/Co efflux regulator RcnB
MRVKIPRYDAIGALLLPDPGYTLKAQGNRAAEPVSSNAAERDPNSMSRSPQKGVPMKAICRNLVVSALAFSLLGSVTMAQDHRDDQQSRDHQQEQHYVHHKDWRKGGHISHDDWNRGAQVDWHAHHLRQPPRGYDWREVDGNYVLAAVASGVIASVIIASHSH